MCCCSQPHWQYNTTPKCKQDDSILGVYLYSEHVLMGALFCLLAPSSLQRSTAMPGVHILSFITKTGLRITLRWSICVSEEPVTSSPSENTIDFSAFAGWDLNLTDLSNASTTLHCCVMPNPGSCTGSRLSPGHGVLGPPWLPKQAPARWAPGWAASGQRSCRLC